MNDYVKARQCYAMRIIFTSYSLDRQLNQDSITSCSRNQLIHFSPHKYVFGKTVFKHLGILKKKLYQLIKSQAVTIKKIPSPEVRYTLFL